MKGLTSIAAIAVAAGLLAASTVTVLVVRRNALYDASGPSRIEHDFRRELALIEAVDSGGVGYAGDNLAFGQLVLRIHGRYPIEEAVKLAKSPDPIKAMLGIELLACAGRTDYLVRHLGDQREIEFLSGCTIRHHGPIGEVLARYYDIDDYAQRHRLQLDLFKVVLVEWG